MAGVCTGPGPCVTTPLGTKKNWVTKAGKGTASGGLPPYIRAIAHAQRRNGRSESEAIRLAVGIARRWKNGEGNVTAATRARARAAIAEWDRLKARAHTHLAVQGDPMSTVDLARSGITARVMPDRAAVVRLAKAVEAWPDSPKREQAKRQIARRARTLGMAPDGDGDFDYDTPGHAPVRLANESPTSAAGRRRLAAHGEAMADDRFPIPNRAYLEKAVRMAGMAKGDKTKVRRYIIARARALGASDMIPKTWRPDGTLTLRGRMRRR